MKFKVAKIVMPLELGEYAEVYSGKRLLVWVNPPRDVKHERENILHKYSQTLKRVLKPESDAPVIKAKKTRGFIARMFTKPDESAREVETINERMFAWLNQIWSQHEDEDCAWPVEDIRELYDADPAMYQWMVRRSVQMIAEFRSEAKKK
jgi:hypothetical protein